MRNLFLFNITSHYVCILESRIDKVVCTRRELFEIIRNDLQSNLDTQLECLEQHFATKIKCFQIHVEDRKTLKFLLSKLKWRWKLSQRTTERFLQNNEEWLSSSMIINVSISECFSNICKRQRSSRSKW